MALRIEHRVGVAAPADVIWELVYQVERWPEWNPLYPEAKGQVAVGATLALTEALPGRPRQAIQPVIVDWEPNSQILWRAGGVLAKCVRYIEIEALSEAGCIFANGAFFHGVLGEQQAKSHRRAIHQGYEGFGQAVKQYAERQWAERGGDG